MMNVELQKLSWVDAYAGYEAARAALKNHPEAKHLKIASRAYFHMKKGRAVLDVYTAIKKAGLNADGEPRLGIAPSNALKGSFFKNRDGGNGYYFTNGGRWGYENKHLTIPANTFPDWPKESTDRWANPKRQKISSPVPLVPEKLMPRNALSNYFTMWEVDHWTAEPAVDPILLQRLSDNLFIVLGSWDTTPLERSILRGMYR